MPESLPFLPFALPDLTETEIDAVVRVLRSGWITAGPEVKAFEEEFARAVGVKHAIAVSSCTAALHLALESVGVRRGDEVLTTTITFTATAEVVEYLGARTRFVDVEADTLNMSPAATRALIEAEYVRADGEWRHRETGGRLAAIVPVHYAGHLVDMPAFLALGAAYGVPVVDDAAHALPATLDARSVGAWGCPTAFSFYATKTLAVGDGGMLTTDDDAIAARCRIMSLHGISRDAWKRYRQDGTWYYEVVEAGFKYNMTDIAAALGRVQLARLQGMCDRRTALAARYSEAFAGLDGVVVPTVRPGVESAWHLYPIRLAPAAGISRDAFIDAMKLRGIGTSVHFIPLHRQPFYATKYDYRPEQFPVAEEAYGQLVSLPLYSGMSDADAARVVRAVSELVNQRRVLAA
jgi:dTDP-4-amino-4,6-dideoxygalactose transaminase